MHLHFHKSRKDPHHSATLLPPQQEWWERLGKASMYSVGPIQEPIQKVQKLNLKTTTTLRTGWWLNQPI